MKFDCKFVNVKKTFRLSQLDNFSPISIVIVIHTFFINLAINQRYFSENDEKRKHFLPSTVRKDVEKHCHSFIFRCEKFALNWIKYWRRLNLILCTFMPLKVVQEKNKVWNESSRIYVCWIKDQGDSTKAGISSLRSLKLTFT